MQLFIKIIARMPKNHCHPPALIKTKQFVNFIKVLKTIIAIQLFAIL